MNDTALLKIEQKPLAWLTSALNLPEIELSDLPAKLSQRLWVSPEEFLEVTSAPVLAQWAVKVSGCWRPALPEPISRRGLKPVYVEWSILVVALIQVAWQIGYGLIALDLIQPWIPPFTWPANIAGGLIFGLGMVIASTCVTGLFYKLGHGMLRTLAGLAAWAVGDVVVYRGPPVAAPGNASERPDQRQRPERHGAQSAWSRWHFFGGTDLAAGRRLAVEVSANINWPVLGLAKAGPGSRAFHRPGLAISPGQRLSLYFWHVGRAQRRAGSLE